MMTVEVVPPEGKTSFTGIPESQFIDDVDSYMKGEDNAEAKIKSFDEVIVMHTLLVENNTYWLIRLIKNTNSWRTVWLHAGRD